jgi:hypothetical protein
MWKRLWKVTPGVFAGLLGGSFAFWFDHAADALRWEMLRRSIE